MTDDGLPDLPDVETPFDRRVSSLIDTETTPFEMVAGLDERDLPMPEVDRKEVVDQSTEYCSVFD